MSDAGREVLRLRALLWTSAIINVMLLSLLYRNARLSESIVDLSTGSPDNALASAAPTASSTRSAARLHIVIVRYRESVSWTVPYAADVFLYQQGAELPAETFPVVRQLDNVGREPHSYLNYILEFWDELPDTTVFTQADPSNFELTRLNATMLQEILQGRAAHSPRPARYAPGFPGEGYFRDHPENPAPESWSLKEFWSKNLPDVPLPDDSNCGSYPAFFTAFMSVPRSAIRSRPRSFYERMYKIASVKVNRPISCHFFERLWFIVGASGGGDDGFSSLSQVLLSPCRFFSQTSGRQPSMGICCLSHLLRVSRAGFFLDHSSSPSSGLLKCAAITSLLMSIRHSQAVAH